MPKEREEELIFTNQVDKKYMLEKRNRMRLNKRIQSIAWILRITFVLLLIAYIVSPLSRIQVIRVIGNEIFSKEYILETSQIEIGDIYYGIIPFAIENRLQKNPLIKKANVERHGSRIISITLQEKEVIASFDLDGSLHYLCTDGTYTPLTNDNSGYMTRVPYIVGLEEDMDLLISLAKPLSKVNKDVLEMMSEIVWYKLNYDNTQLKVNMVDHNYVFISIGNMESINSYRKIAATLTSSNECIYYDSNATHPYTSTCLFDIEEETNEDGNDGVIE